MLHSLQCRAKSIQSRVSRHSLFGCGAREANKRVQFVHRAVGIDAQSVFCDTLPPHKACLSGIACTGVYFAQHHSAGLWNGFSSCM